MTMYQTPRPMAGIPFRASGVPTAKIEFAYYACLLYSIIGDALGVAVSFVGAGALVLLAALCAMRFKRRALTFYTPIAPALWCAISFVAIQVGFHNEPIMDEDVRVFVTWIPSLILLYSLAWREGFLDRFVFVLLGIGLSAMPFIEYEASGDVQRAALSHEVSGLLSGANGLGGWFGFCGVYFLIRAIERKQVQTRLFSSLLAVACLLVVGLTVSRGVLASVAISVVLAFQRSLKKTFIPVLLLAVLFALALFSGLLDPIVRSYVERGTEETGRLLVWPVALERFVDSPFLGVGVSAVATDIDGRWLTPHNSFLYLGLASGIVPLGFFVIYFWRAFSAAINRSVKSSSKEAPYFLPLICYSFGITSASNVPFMVPWVIAMFSVAIGARAQDLGAPMLAQGPFTQYGTSTHMRPRLRRT